MIFFVLIALPLASLTEAYSYHAQQIGKHPGFQVLLNHQGGQQLIKVFRPSTIRGLPRVRTSPTFRGGNQQSQNLRALTTELKILAANPAFAAVANQNIKDLDLQCISNIDEAVATLESATDLFESIVPESQAIVDKLKSIEQLKSPGKILREFSVVLRMVQPLVARTTSIKEIDDCPSAGGLGTFTILATQIRELAQNPGLRFNLEVRTALEQAVPQIELSAKVVAAVRTFHNDLQSISTSTAGLCKGSFQYARATMAALGTMMEKTADLLSSFDFYYGKTDQSLVVVEKLRFAAVKMDEITAQLEDHFAGLETGNPECPTSGSGLDLWGSADSLEDLSNIVEDIGVENLQQQFKSLSFNFV
jgi:hypothetical protein